MTNGYDFVSAQVGWQVMPPFPEPRTVVRAGKTMSGTDRAYAEGAAIIRAGYRNKADASLHLSLLLRLSGPFPGQDDHCGTEVAEGPEIEVGQNPRFQFRRLAPTVNSCREVGDGKVRLPQSFE